MEYLCLYIYNTHVDYQIFIFCIYIHLVFIIIFNFYFILNMIMEHNFNLKYNHDLHTNTYWFPLYSLTLFFYCVYYWLCLQHLLLLTHLYMDGRWCGLILRHSFSFYFVSNTNLFLI